MTIYEEFMLLREFEKTENELEMKLTTKKEEHLDMQTKLAEAQLKIDNKRKDLEKLDENYKQLSHTFEHLIHEETKYNDFLKRVYKRKIKRKKKNEGQEEDEGQSIKFKNLFHFSLFHYLVDFFLQNPKKNQSSPIRTTRTSMKKTMTVKPKEKSNSTWIFVPVDSNKICSIMFVSCARNVSI